MQVSYDFSTWLERNNNNNKTKCNFSLINIARLKLETYLAPTESNLKGFDYTKQLNNYFRDENHYECMIHGIYPKHLYNIVLQVNNIGECQLICYNMHHRKIKLEQIKAIFNMQVNENDCTVFTFNYNEKECHLSDKIDFTTLRTQNEHKEFDKFISATQNCKPNLITYKSQFAINNLN